MTGTRTGVALVPVVRFLGDLIEFSRSKKPQAQTIHDCWHPVHANFLKIFGKLLNRAGVAERRMAGGGEPMQSGSRFLGRISLPSQTREWPHRSNGMLVANGEPAIFQWSTHFSCGIQRYLHTFMNVGLFRKPPPPSSLPSCLVLSSCLTPYKQFI